ncbi:MAG: hypothetical protein K2H23_07125 [Oscillospiraceae bacterium]|nr:hypothetical protein [Oscillospiraceae bacterium]
MNIGIEACCFMRLLKTLLDDDGNYLLPTKEFENICNAKNLLGYYDRDYIYIIPSIVIGMCDNILIQHKVAPLNMQKILKQLFALNMIKVHWVLTDEVRYRPQKRIVKTRRRYITFYKKQFTKYIAKECF